MLRKTMCKLFAKIIKGESKSIENEHYILIRKDESLEPTIKFDLVGFKFINLYVPIIIIEGNYDRLFNDDEIRFIVYHELYQCKYNYFKSNKYDLDYMIAADNYAMHKVGKDVAISALEKIKEEARWTGHSSSDIVVRIFECSHTAL